MTRKRASFGFAFALIFHIHLRITRSTHRSEATPLHFQTLSSLSPWWMSFAAGSLSSDLASAVTRRHQRHRLPHRWRPALDFDSVDVRWPPTKGRARKFETRQRYVRGTSEGTSEAASDSDDSGERRGAAGSGGRMRAAGEGRPGSNQSSFLPIHPISSSKLMERQFFRDGKGTGIDTRKAFPAFRCGLA